MVFIAGGLRGARDKVASMRHEGSKAGVDQFPLGVGAYTVSESTRVIRQRVLRELQKKSNITNKQLIRWAHGRHESARDYAPFIIGASKVGNDYMFTFVQLIELLAIATFRASGVPTARIREAYSAAEAKYGNHPFARERYRTDGVGIFTAADDPEPEELSSGQTFFEEALRSILLDVSYLDGRAAKFAPLGITRAVVLDPGLSFGQPVESHTGVPTATLYAMRANGESFDEIAEWFGAPVAGVRDAVEYEEALRKAA